MAQPGGTSLAVAQAMEHAAIFRMTNKNEAAAIKSRRADDATAGSLIEIVASHRGLGWADFIDVGT